jgi:hypothetical protein
MAYKNATGAGFNVVPITDATQVLPSVLSGTNDCALYALSTLKPGLASGAIHLVVDPQDLATVPKDTLQGTIGISLWGLKANLQEKRSAMVKLMKALLQADQYMKTATAREVGAALHKFPDLQTFTEEQLATLYEAEKPFLAPERGFISKEVWPATLRLYAYGTPFVNGTDAKWSYEQRVDMSYFNAAAGK